MTSVRTVVFCVPVLAAWCLAAGQADRPGQAPKAMHDPMPEAPIVRAGITGGDITGADNRALQAAVDYVAGLGGGIVEIGEGTYLMYDSLHLRPHVTVRGQGTKTVLKKAASVSSPLAADGDYGEEQITVRNPEGFKVGDGVAIWDENSGGFHTTVARITGKNGNTFSISKPLNADVMMANKGQAATVFPVISGYDLEGVRIENLTVDGNRAENVWLNGCRGAGIFLYRGFGTVIENCVVRNYNGDGISFQQSNDVRVIRCVSEGNAQLGIHPGSGSQRPVVQNNIARGNGGDGLYLCWRVKHGVFEDNELIANGGQGISIGHKDTDNLLRRNIVRRNAKNGVLFREELEPMAGHRNRLEENRIEDNGEAGIQVSGETNGVVLVNNVISDTRDAGARTQKIGISIGPKAGEVKMEGNRIAAERDVEKVEK